MRLVTHVPAVLCSAFSVCLGQSTHHLGISPRFAITLRSALGIAQAVKTNVLRSDECPQHIVLVAAVGQGHELLGSALQAQRALLAEDHPH